MRRATNTLFSTLDRMISVAGLATSIFLCSTAIAQNGGLKFKLTDLGANLGTQSEAWAINNSGQAVGDYVWLNRRTGQTYQFCFSEGSGQSPVAFGNSPCTARAVNAGGAIAGWMQSGSATHAFRRDVNGNLYDLPPDPGSGSDSYAFGIDASGRAVGAAGLFGNVQNSPAYQWDLGGHPTVLNCLNPPDTFGQIAFATNPAGNYLAGTCYVWSANGNQPYWWVNGMPSQLATLSGCSSLDRQAVVLALTNGNYMVGYGSAPPECDSYGAPHAVLWAPAPVDLGRGTANAISNDNWIVGVNGSGLGFLRVPDPVCPQTVALNLLLDSSGTGWSVNAAYGINDSHQIVGQGLAPNGQYHAILLTPVNNLPLCQPD